MCVRKGQGVMIMISGVCVCVSACVSGRFGLGCEGRCECDHGAACHHVSGQCLCPAGWRGRRCEKGQFITCVTITSMSRMLNSICTFICKCCSIHFRCYFNVSGATLGGSCTPGVLLLTQLASLFKCGRPHVCLKSSFGAMSHQMWSQC